MIDLFVNLPNPIPKLQQAPLPPKCYEPRRTPQLLLLPLYSPLDSKLSPLRSLEVHSQFHSISSSKKMEKFKLEKSHKGKRHIFKKICVKFI